MACRALSSPTFFSLRGPAKALHQRAREAGELCGWTDGRIDGRMDSDQKCTSIFLILMYVKDHIYIYVLICVLKSCHQDSYGFQNSMSSLGVGVMNFENTAGRWLFRFLVPNLSLAAWKRRSRLPISDSRCAPAACHPHFRTDAYSRWVMPQLGVLSVCVSENAHYYL